MFDPLFIDVAPEPAGPAILFVILCVIGVVVLLAGALVTFLWLRKRSTRYLEMNRFDNDTRFPQNRPNHR